MQLNSVTVRNYRIHKDLRVELSDSLTLVGGPNESGKSTLMEAVHRALFLKASAGGELQKEMVSDRHSGHPEVEVEFTAGGKDYTVTKTFSGPSGKATLREENGATFHNAEAESRLAEILGVEDAGGKRVNKNTLEGQWAHLWISQGRSGDDPSAEAAGQKDALLARLKYQGGGVVMQSENDAKVANHFEDEFLKIFTPGGKVKAGTDLEAAVKELGKARAELAEAEEDLRNLEGAVTSFESAEKIIERHSAELRNLDAELTQCEKSLKKAGELRQSLEKAESNHANAEEKRTQFQQSLDSVAAIRQEIEALDKNLKPVTGKIEKLTEHLDEAKKLLSSREKELSAAEKSLTDTRKEGDLLSALSAALESESRLKELETEKDEIQAIGKKIDEARDKLAKLPGISSENIASLQKLDARHSELRSILEALATGIEVTRAKSDVSIEGRPISEGDKLTIDTETVLKAGEDFIFKITPGGGTRIAETRHQLADITSEREQFLQTLGVESLKEAQDILQDRTVLEGKLRDWQTEQKAKGPEKLNATIDELSLKAKTARAEVERRSADKNLPDTPTEAASLLTSKREEYRLLDSRVADLKIERETATRAIDELEGKLLTEKRTAQEVQNRLLELRTQLQLKEEPLGPPEERTQQLQELEKAARETAATLTETKEQLQQLQPETLAADSERFARAIEQSRTEVERAKQQRAIAGHELSKSKGAFDPAAAVAVARAAEESASDRHKRLERKAEAIRLLHERFTAEQQRLADRFSQPLAEKVSDYLQQLFGANAKASVTISDGVPGGWTISRDGEAFDFDKLSGGTKEQLAGAVRLAIAEILAEDHGGKLPIVFDDAFTYSDPERTKSLQRMLDHAARRGLQVILLTCDPSSYTALGADTVSLG